jgi:predicted pyridoxine 5'-phosphate oxidase superfamily flavin-nucleotide-binding protein
MSTVISDAVVEFMSVARSVAVGTCDDKRMPYGTRVGAVRLWPDRQHVTVFLADAIAGPTLANLRINPRVGIQISNPPDHRTLQLKGALHAIRAAEPADHAYIRRFIEELAESVSTFGMPAERVVRMTSWPACAIDVRVEEIFLQTPGPGAGRPLAGRAP